MAALGVHWLRYELAFGGSAEHELVAQGHQYLSSAVPFVALAAALVAAELVARVAGARRGDGDAPPSSRLLMTAAAITTVLVLIYAGQEFLEGFIASGHPGGFFGVFGDGGWWSVPVAIVFGFLIALALRVAEVAVSIVARLSSPGKARQAPATHPRPPSVLLPAPSPFAGAAPGRAPPVPALA